MERWPPVGRGGESQPPSHPSLTEDNHHNDGNDDYDYDDYDYDDDDYDDDDNGNYNNHHNDDNDDGDKEEGRASRPHIPH